MLVSSGRNSRGLRLLRLRRALPLCAITCFVVSLLACLTTPPRINWCTAPCGFGRAGTLVRRACGVFPEVEEEKQSCIMPWAGANVTALTSKDVDCLTRRQLFYPREIVNNFALGCGRRCSHGWPQAILCDPLQHGFRVAVFVTCPLLTTAIESFENEGAIDRYNERIRKDAAWRQQLADGNAAHQALRQEIRSARVGRPYADREDLSEGVVDLIMGRGMDLAMETTRIRCMHTQVADELVRGGNVIGQQVLSDLEKRGVDTHGNKFCHQHCSMETPLDQVQWKFASNKGKLRRLLKRQALREGCREEDL